MRVPKIAAALAAGATGVGALAWLNRRIEAQAMDSTRALPGEQKTFDWFGSRIAYTEAGTGRPVLLVHGFGAGNDSWQWRHLFPRLAQDYHVFAYDQIGFGRSDRPDMLYHADWYVHLQEYFLERIAGQPAVVVSSSLAGAHTILAAADRPELITSLVLLAPTGTVALAGPPNPAQALAGELLRFPVLGSSLYYYLTSWSNIHHEVYDNLYAEPGQVDAGNLMPHLYATSHRPGARHGVAAFLGGQLNADVAESLARLAQPVTIVWGEQAKTTPVWQARSFTDINPKVRLLTCENAGLAVESECPEVVKRAVDEAASAAQLAEASRQTGA